MISLAFPAASVKLYINNSLIGIANSLEYSIDTGRTAIYGIDQIKPFELAPQTYSVRGTISCIRSRFDGSLESRGIVANQADVLMEKYITITLVDRLTDTVIFKADNSAVISQNWIYSSRELVKGTFTFEAIDYFNETTAG